MGKLLLQDDAWQIVHSRTSFGISVPSNAPMPQTKQDSVVVKKTGYRRFGPRHKGCFGKRCALVALVNSNINVIYIFTTGFIKLLIQWKNGNLGQGKTTLRV